MKKILYLMRHGETLFNEKRKIQGACDSPLTELGAKQAKIAGEYLKNMPLDHAYCSTSERSCDTLEIILNDRLPYTRLKGLKEMNYGLFEGESQDLNPKSLDDFETFFVPYGGESRSDVKERMVKTCTEIMEKDNHVNVLAVSHSGACFNFLDVWQDSKNELAKGFPNCCIFKYEYEDRTFTLLEVIRHDFESYLK
ncbi:histidine phosphatase family protein [Virgibacillus sp. NKC19-3]|uniref:histidine phosphatase family protein n=1 Tax=Virgibacillus saliphilus TaxID=2831674 RepID=UPI001C9A4AD8|nr:histidine phosphatase family protein [Virgibacillus sp. NKC19-3]MBY7142267.1 histidine phosphatase family protein [Virgibacillus sp. NKC19-3]